MILDRLHIPTFAGLTSESIEFKPDLNLIVGPNEAGKSTLFQAILNTLLTPVKLTKTKFQSAMERFLPIGGGDTITSELKFSHEGRSYLLSKSWGNSPAAELILPDGSRITNEDSIIAALKLLLPAHEGTIRSILMTYQSGLTGTLEELKSNPDTVNSLSDILRKAVLETDGVSIGKLKSLIVQKSNYYFEHWDLDRERPEGNRGIDNPYRKGVGQVLQAYYDYQKLAHLLEEVLAKEEEFSVLNKQLDECVCLLREKEKFVKENEKAARDARERTGIEAQLQAAGLSGKIMQEDYDRWPVLLTSVKNLSKELPTVEKLIGDLQSEKNQAEAFEKNKELQALFARVTEKRKRLEESEVKLKGIRLFPRRDLAEILQVSAAVERLKAALSAGRINLNLQAKAPLVLSVEQDLETPTDEKMAKGDSLELHSEGRILLTHHDWVLEVTAGEGDHKSMRENYSKAEEKLHSLFSAKKISSLAEAEKACSEYEELNSKLENARDTYIQELGEYSYDDLESKIAGSGVTIPGRALKDIWEELVKSESRLAEIEKELAEANSEIGHLTEKYRDKNGLFERIVDLAGRKKELQKQIEDLTALPEAFADADSFLTCYEQEKQALEDLKEKKNKLEIDCAKAEENMPDESSEEIKTRLEESENIYKSELKKGRAVDKIRQISDSLLQELDSGTLKGFDKLLSDYTREITGNHYSRVQMEDVLPQGLLRDDGQILPYRLLSTGTKDVFAISLRLAMAEFFLAGKEGFLMMDDPLVDLDPERQQLAVKILSRFSEGRQLIIFTCHPSHAESFASANRVELTTPAI